MLLQVLGDSSPTSHDPKSILTRINSTKLVPVYQRSIAYLADSDSNSASKDPRSSPALALRAQIHLCEYISRQTHWIPDPDIPQQTQEPAYSLADLGTLH